MIISNSYNFSWLFTDYTLRILDVAGHVIPGKSQGASEPQVELCEALWL